MNSRDKINKILEEQLAKAKEDGKRLENPLIYTIVSDTFEKLSEYMTDLRELEEPAQDAGYMKIAVALESVLFTLKTQHANDVQELWDKEVSRIADNILAYRIEAYRKAAYHIREAAKLISELAK